MPDNSIDCCVTSPPFYNLRDYQVDGQIGLEETPELFIERLVAVFAEVRRVLKPEGNCWINMADTYAANRSYQVNGTKQTNDSQPKHGSKIPAGLKPKDQMFIPHRLAIALQSDGWYARDTIIWSKPNPMPESVTDRCTKSHEYIFMFTKSPTYYYDHEAIKEPVTASTIARLNQDIESQAGSTRVPGKTNGTMKAVGGRASSDSFKRENSKRGQAIPGQTRGTHRPDRAESAYPLDTRNKRSVWSVPTIGYAEAHFATFPPNLIVPCIKAGCPVGGTVLDPFCGAGTTALVARKLGRNYIGFELNESYIKIANARLERELGPLTALFQ